MGLFHSPKIVTDGLVLALDAANIKSYPGSGTTWSDMSGKNNNATLTNGPTFSSDDGGSIVFDGSNDFVDGVHNDHVNLTGSVTCECWFQITGSTSDWVRLIGKGSGSNRTYGLWYHQSYSGGYWLYQRYGTANVGQTLAKPVSQNVWHHMVGTSASDVHALYVDGVLVSGPTSSGSSFHTSTDNFTIGYAGYHTYHAGNIAVARIYNKGLTAAEVRQNYEATKGRFGL